ncbi:conserved protein of unknown function (plasmid) [Cupriavidus taiwanensis]|uniref:Uncharacterized protein n=1 Tax=Cupriavidus taiwanensis TaxID=164546 RepID=A0A375ILR5_9BURK|nr:conserved protein of unknown function [Cupriavidus taiwanensis]
MRAGSHGVARSARQAQCKGRFGDQEQRADQQPDQVVDESRLAPFVIVADELDHPSHHEQADAEREPPARRHRRDMRAGIEEHRKDQRHRHAEAQRQAQVEQARQDIQQHCRRQHGVAVAQCQCRPRQQRGHRQHDHRDADEMREDIARVAMVGGVVGEMFDQGFHGGVSWTALWRARVGREVDL